MKKIIGFDLDGVIIDHSKAKVSLAEKLGYRVNILETPASIIRTLMPKDSYKKLKNTLYDHPVIALKSPLMFGVRERLEDLREKNVPFFLISRRQTAKMPIELLKKHRLWPDFFNENNVSFVKERRDKNTRAIELGVTHYIDDEPEVLAELVDVKNRFLFDPLDIFKETLYKKIRSWDTIDF